MDYIDNENTPIGTTRSSELDSEGDGRDSSRQPLEQAKNKAKDLAGQAKQQARSKGEKQKARATDEIEHLASALHDAGSQLDREQMSSGRFIHAAADRLENFSTKLDSRDVDGLVREGRKWARSNPAAFLGSAVALGFVASRFLKASSDDDEGDGSGYDGDYPTDLPGSAGYDTGARGMEPMTTTPRTTAPRSTTPRMTTPGTNLPGGTERR